MFEIVRLKVEKKERGGVREREREREIENDVRGNYLDWILWILFMNRRRYRSYVYIFY